MRIAGHKVKLTADHLSWMRVPPRFWRVSFDSIQEGEHRDRIRAYLRQIDDMLDGGVGYLFWGNNSLGKTSAAVVLLKEARRHGASGLFITAESLRQALLSKEKFADDLLVYDRAEQVDVLLLDDLGKEVVGGSDWSPRTFENLLRVRSAHRRTTIITTNVPLEALAERYSVSFREVLKEVCVPVRVVGHSYRDDIGAELRTRLATG